MRILKLSKGGSTACLNGLDLVGRQNGPMEAGGQLVAVEEDTLGRDDGAEVGTRRAADAAIGGRDSLAQGTKLLCVVAVRAEGGV